MIIVWARWLSVLDISMHTKIGVQSFYPYAHTLAPIPHNYIDCYYCCYFIIHTIRPKRIWAMYNIVEHLHCTQQTTKKIYTNEEEEDRSRRKKNNSANENNKVYIIRIIENKTMCERDVVIHCTKCLLLFFARSLSSSRRRRRRHLFGHIHVFTECVPCVYGWISEFPSDFEYRMDAAATHSIQSSICVDCRYRPAVLVCRCLYIIYIYLCVSRFCRICSVC